MPKKFVEFFFFFTKKIFFCENEKLDCTRFLEDFYYHGTLNLPSIRGLTSICNWITFCGLSPSNVSNFWEKRLESKTEGKLLQRNKKRKRKEEKKQFRSATAMSKKLTSYGVWVRQGSWHTSSKYNMFFKKFWLFKQ